MSHPSYSGLSQYASNIISRVAIRSARAGMLSPIHRGVFNLVERHHTINRDTTASFVWAEGILTPDETEAYRTLLQAYHDYPHIFAIISTTNSTSRAQAIEDALNFDAERVRLSNTLQVSPGVPDATELHELLESMRLAGLAKSELQIPPDLPFLVL